MTEWTLREERVEVPKGAGVDGFLRTIRTLLALPRLQEIHIDARGAIRHARFVAQGEAVSPVAVDFDDLMPWAICRAGTVVEVALPSKHAAVALAALFEAAARDALAPIAWVTGANTTAWRWFERTTGIPVTGSSVFGLPVLRDRQVEDDVLLLCAAYGRAAEFVTTQKTYKLSVPEESHGE